MLLLGAFGQSSSTKRVGGGCHSNRSHHVKLQVKTSAFNHTKLSNSSRHIRPIWRKTFAKTQCCSDEAVTCTDARMLPPGVPPSGPSTQAQRVGGGCAGGPGSVRGCCAHATAHRKTPDQRGQLATPQPAAAGIGTVHTHACYRAEAVHAVFVDATHT
jgi:hypothetical protein